MRIQKRDGSYQDVDLNKITNRIKYMVDGIDTDGNVIGDKLSIDPLEISIQVIQQIVDGIKSSELDELAAEICAYKICQSLDYGVLAGRIIVSNHHKNTQDYQKFSDIIEALYNNVDTRMTNDVCLANINTSALISKKFYETVIKHKQILDSRVQESHKNDYRVLDYFGFKTLEKSYLLKATVPVSLNLTDTPRTKTVRERYQHLLMREALAMNINDIDRAIECYNELSGALYTHATPTMFNSGTPQQQLSSCFLMGVHDSIEGMYETSRRMAHISKWAGGIGVWLSKIRSEGSRIRGTNGNSTGIVPYIKVLNELARHVNQGGKRKGSIAVYLTPYHSDIFRFLEMKKNTGSEEMRARDIFYALFIPDLFMKRLELAINRQKEQTTDVNHKVMWSLFCPDEAKGLEDTYGEQFETLYTEYENKKMYKEQVDILKLWDAIIVSQQETSTPYMLYSDNINRKSNQQNLGMVKSSNLCAEICLYSDHEEYAVCNLASISLRAMVETDRHLLGENTMTERVYDMFELQQNSHFLNFEKLRRVVHSIVRNLNNVIDYNYYPVPETRKSNFRHRPIGIGVQGFADMLFLLNMSFDSQETRKLNRAIFEVMYLSAVEMSIQLAKEHKQMLMTHCSVDELKKLKKTANDIVYYNEYFNDYKLKGRTYNNLTDTERNVFNFNNQMLNDTTRNYRKFIETHNMPDNIYDYQYINIFGTPTECQSETVQRGMKQSSASPLSSPLASLLASHTNGLSSPPLFIDPYQEQNENGNVNYITNGINESHISQASQTSQASLRFYAINGPNAPRWAEGSSISKSEKHEVSKYIGAYNSFVGSPASRGRLQYHLAEKESILQPVLFPNLLNDLEKHGLRNSKLIALMPTASSAAVLGNNECFEPYLSNIFTKQVLSGSFIIVNKSLQQSLERSGLWNERMKDMLLLKQGSIADIVEIPEEMRALYKTAFEIKTKVILDLAIDRTPFIDQSQSLNIFVDDPTLSKLTSIHLYGWKGGLKTGMYYLRRRTLVDPQKFSVNIDTQLKIHKEEREKIQENNCTMCQA